MAIVTASGGAGSRGHQLLWELSWDSVGRDLTVIATHTKFDGSEAIGPPQVAVIEIGLANGSTRLVNLGALDVVLADGRPAPAIRAPSDSQFGLINKGPQTFTNLNLRLSADRAAALAFSTFYTPPVGA